MSHPQAHQIAGVSDLVAGAANAHLRMVPWRISGGDFQEICRSLSFDYLKWDMYLGGQRRVLPESIVLSQQTHAHLVRVTEAFAGLMRRFESGTRRDRGLMAALGIDPSLYRLLEAESTDEPAFTRADFFLTQDGRWVLSEFNEDVPGGFNEAVGIPALLTAAELGGQTAGDLRHALCDAFAGCDRIGLISATAFSEDLQHCAVLSRWLRERGHDTLRASPEHLQQHWHGPRLAGRNVQGIFRFFPGEWFARLPNLADWRRALPRLKMMNPLVRLLSQSKKCFGLWRSGTALHEADRQFARQYCPGTEPFERGLLEQYRAHRDGLVLKRAFGRMGDAVEIGALCNAQEWDAALSSAARRPRDYALQERFLVEPVAMASGIFYPTIGVYAVNGRFAGYYSRVARQPFITHEAHHVATVIEAA